MAGGVKVEDHSGEFLDELEKSARRSMNRTGKQAVERMQRNAPIGKTRKLYDGIGMKIEKQPAGLILRAGGRDPKTHLHNFGTAKMKRTPFVTDGTKDMGERFEEEFEKDYGKLVRKTERP